MPKTIRSKRLEVNILMTMDYCNTKSLWNWVFLCIVASNLFFLNDDLYFSPCIDNDSGISWPYPIFCPSLDHYKPLLLLHPPRGAGYWHRNFHPYCHGPEGSFLHHKLSRGSWAKWRRLRGLFLCKSDIRLAHHRIYFYRIKKCLKE